MISEEKIKAASDRIAIVLEKHAEVTYVGHSGGKDSCVIRYLVDTFPGYNIISVHNPKPITHPKTVDFLYREAQRASLAMIAPHEMQEFIKMNDYRVQIDGTRIAEATRQDGRSTEVVINGILVNRTLMAQAGAFVKNGLFGLSFCYPIFDWTDDEVWAFIRQERIPVSMEYDRSDNA